MVRSEGWVVTLLVVFVFILLWVKWPSPLSTSHQSRPKPTPRPLKPRTPDDCPHEVCRAAQPALPPASTPLKPYSQIKSSRGRRKRIATAGYACPNCDCLYYGITDEHIHALVGCGGHGRQEYIRASRLKCQACRTRFSIRYGTARYRLKTPARRVGEVLRALAEGLSVAAAVRVLGHSERSEPASRDTRRIARRLTARAVIPRFEAATRPVGCGRAVCTKTRQETDALWVWFAVDAHTQIIPVLKVGPRTQALAQAVVHALVKVLAADGLPVFTSDGLKRYFYALTAHCGNWVETAGRQKPCWQLRADLWYGQLIKHCRRRRLVRVERRALLGSLDQLPAAMLTFGWSGKIQTAFVERLNLTVRQGIAALTRRTWGLAQSPAELLLHLQWWRARFAYHFTRPHMSLDETVPEPYPRGGRRWPRRYRQRTPAQAAGLTDHRWTLVELLSRPLPITVD